MRNRFERQLLELNNELIQMGSMIERAIEMGISALVRQDVEKAKKAIAYDEEIDEQEKTVESLCMKLLLQQQPVAKDLRLISAALKMITDMERIGDHAADISEMTILMSDATYERSAINIDLVESMAKEKAGMLYPRGGGNPATGGLAAAALGVTAVQLGMTAGVLTAGAGIAAVAATASSDRKNGTESSLGDYISNAFSASARVGASCIAITLGMYGAEVMTLTVSGGMGLIPVGGTVVTLPQLAGAFQLVAGIVTSQNLLFQMRGVLMFCISGKEMGAPTGNWLYDSARELTEMASMQFAVYGLMNPYTYQRPKITPLPNETGLTVPGGTGVAVVPNGTAPALKQPYLPGQYTEYPAAVQGLAQQALPGGESSIETSSKTIDDIIDGLPETTNGKGVARNFESTGDFEQTIRDFDALNPIDVKEIQTKYGPGKVGKLSDGTTVVARPGSTTGGATLEIRVSNRKVYKIRY